MSKYKSLMLTQSKIIEKCEKENYLNNINQDIAFVIFTFIDTYEDLFNLLKFPLFEAILKNPYSWTRKLKTNFPFINTNFLGIKEFTSYLFINVGEYYKNFDFWVNLVERVRPKSPKFICVLIVCSIILFLVLYLNILK